MPRPRNLSEHQLSRPSSLLTDRQVGLGQTCASGGEPIRNPQSTIRSPSAFIAVGQAGKPVLHSFHPSTANCQPLTANYFVNCHSQDAMLLAKSVVPAWVHAANQRYVPAGKSGSVRLNGS